MSLNSDLQTLKTNIEGVKSTLYTNLTNKGVTSITESDTLTTLANKVSTITAGGSGVDFSPIGYDSELSSEINAKWNNDIAYSKTLYDKWNPSNASSYGLYSGDTKIVYAPNIDTSNVYTMLGMFKNCTNLKIVPLYNTSKARTMEDMFSNCISLTSVPLFNTSIVENMSGMFYYCSNLKTVPLFNTSKVTGMTSMFEGCSGLTSVPLFNTIAVTAMSYMFSYCSILTKIPEMNTSKVKNFRFMFNDCSSLTKIEGISFKSFSDSTMDKYYLVGYGRNDSIRKAVFKDIGYQSTAVQFNTELIENWGVNTSEIQDARQSLIDSLITYSFDRASAGYSTCEITLSSTTKALLTSDEISQINAKGFTIA